MSSTNRKRSARALAARMGITYQQAWNMLNGAQEAVCDRCGGTWGSDDSCERCTFEDGSARPLDEPGPLGPGANTGTPACPACRSRDVDYRPVEGNPTPWDCHECGTSFDPSNPLAGLTITWADADGSFEMYDGSPGNPGCDECGEEDALACVNGEYLCRAAVWARRIPIPKGLSPARWVDPETVCTTPDCPGDASPYGDGYAGFCPDCADRLFALTCRYCGEAMHIEETTEVSHHTNEDGGIDYAADADHVAVRDDEDFITG